MTRRQTFILGIGLGVLTLMAAFPPWKETSAARNNAYIKPVGYCFVLSRPSRRNSDGRAVSVDLERLGVQIVAVIAGTASAVLLMGLRPRKVPGE